MSVSEDETQAEDGVGRNQLVSERRLFYRVPMLIYAFLASVKLAIVLLVAILVCCVTGVTLLRGQRAWQLIFSTYWFNGLLALLVINIAFCFFGRLWRRRLTLVSFGMILFHLSFVGLLCGIVYNSLYQFEGMLRLTEGEALPNHDPESYDFYRHGSLFKFSRLRGVTQLVKVHWGYKEDGKDKAVAYEIAIDDGQRQKQDIIYITRNLDFNGVTYYPEKEGYAPLIVIGDKNGNYLYSAFVPLQSLRQKDGTFIHTTGTKEGPTPMDFPKGPKEKAIFFLQLLYRPSPVHERGGDITFVVWPPWKWDKDKLPLASGNVAIGIPFRSEGYTLTFEELRYWVGMRVRYEPGKMFGLTCLWVGLAGMIITFIGRMRKSKK